MPFSKSWVLRSKPRKKRDGRRGKNVLLPGLRKFSFLSINTVILHNTGKAARYSRGFTQCDWADFASSPIAATYCDPWIIKDFW